MEDKLLNMIISVAYGDASITERIKVYLLARKNHEVKSLLEEYKSVADKAHSIQVDECPSELLKNVKVITDLEQKKGKSLLFDLYSFVFRKPAVSAAILSLFILALVSTFIIKRPEIHAQYSKQEIEEADIQVKHSLALIAEVLKKTSNTVEKDVLTDRVSKPIKESFNLVNEYLQGENNESIN